MARKAKVIDFVLSFLISIDSILNMYFTFCDIFYFPAGTQYSGNTRCVFPQRCNVPDIQGTFGEHLKEKYFHKSSRWKSRFCVKSV